MQIQQKKYSGLQVDSKTYILNSTIKCSSVYYSAIKIHVVNIIPTQAISGHMDREFLSVTFILYNS